MTFERVIKVDAFTILVEVKKRNIERSLLPLDTVTIKNKRYIVNKVEQFNQNVLVTMTKKNKHKTLREWLIKNRITHMVQVANWSKFNACLISAKPYEYLNPKYNHVLDREIKRIQYVDEVYRVWLA